MYMYICNVCIDIWKGRSASSDIFPSWRVEDWVFDWWDGGLGEGEWGFYLGAGKDMLISRKEKKRNWVRVLYAIPGREMDVEISIRGR